MKKAILLFALGSGLSQSMFSQDSISKPIKEIYLGVSSLAPLTTTFKFKKQIARKLFIKMGLNNVNASYNENNYYNGTNNSNNSNLSYSKGNRYSAGAFFGIEFRNKLTDRFTLFHGPGISGTYQYSYEHDYLPPSTSQLDETIGSNSTRYGLNYSLGLLFGINKHFLLAAEVGPGIYYLASTLTSTKYDGNQPSLVVNKSNSSGISYSFNGSSYVMLVYRF